MTGLAAPGFGAAPALAAMGKAETDHAMKTAMAGGASLQMADIGLQKATDARVKMFAQFEHDEQTIIADILKMMAPGMQMPKPDAATAAAIEKLRGTAAGPDFDRMFVKNQIEGHQKLLAIQEEYLAMGKDPATIGVTKLARGQIKEHLALLADMQKAMG